MAYLWVDSLFILRIRYRSDFWLVVKMQKTGYFRKILRSEFKIAILALIFYVLLAIPVSAQMPSLPQITWETFQLNLHPETTIVSSCVRLDGRCVFKILDQKSHLPHRVKYTEARLRDISQTYFKQKDNQLEVYREEQANNLIIYVSAGKRQVPVVTLYPKDATAKGVNLQHQGQHIVNQLNLGLKQAKRERQPQHLIDQAKLAGIISFSIILGQLVVAFCLKRSQKLKAKLKYDDFSLPQPFGDDIYQIQKLNLRLLQYRLLQVTQVFLWLGGILLILGLFPQTRSFQIWLSTLIKIPIRVAVVVLMTYVLIRLSNFLITKLNRTIETNYVLAWDTRRRMHVRINTITRLLVGIMTCILILMGFFTALTLIGINVTPLLAGAGIVGLGFSLASQNIIKDALNGFLIIFEDQYAVGDVINVGDVGGFVEKLTLRITQLRDGQGRLITIPNSEISTVANLSSQWSRAEIDIPIAYQAEIDHALELISQVGQEMEQESDWQQKIIEPPRILGINDFSDRGSVVRIWIKTEPLKQWEVAREFRRRLQKTFKKHNIALPVSQHKVWQEQIKSPFNQQD